jgi:DNA-binding NarL/FixJ family response regulator
MKLAYVEDDKDSSTIFAGKFKADGIACDIYRDAESAQAKINPGSYDILILDIRLPHASGIELLQRLRQKQVHTPCVLITAFNSLEYAREAFGSSANYLLEKPFSYKTLRRVMNKVLEGPGTLQNCVDRGLAKLSLTEREDDVARYLLKGLSNAEIARVISISEKTVKQYLTQIFEKADVSGRAEFFSYIFPV